MKWTDIPQNPIPYFTFENLSNAGFKVNAFTTKLFHSTDGRTFQPLLRADSDPSYISFCLSALLEQFGVSKDHLVPSAQKHSTNIHKITSKDITPGHEPAQLENIDGLITDVPGVMLQIFGADCPGVFLADPVHNAIGLCHSGRKGTQHHIAAKMLAAMEKEYSTSPSDVLGAISPGICVSCYETGDDVASDFMTSYLSAASGTNVTKTADADLLKKGISLKILQFINGRYHIDLPLAISMSLKNAGVDQANIETAGICTKCRSDIFYSFRAEGRISNENCALFMIKPD